MPTHSETKIIPYTAQQIYELVADIDKYPQFLPWCSAARIISKNDDMILAELTIGYKKIKESFTSRVHLDQENKAIYVAYVSGPLRALRNEWIFTDLPDKSCQVDFFVHFEFSSRILSHLMDLFFDVAFKKMVNSFEIRAKEIYG
jgi:coenzyme Q-binding protein COQ10